jgi:alkanesulfonate monooxygenase SsuD/methylene tetrahydromethanopterin reductase-like flavin-dependent oxidoreductase (luciferase family)
MSMKSFGMFDWIDSRGVPLHQLYDERIRLVQAAEAGGFFCYHLAEHHATPLGMAPSPSLFLSALARETSTIHLGPLVYLLPTYNPMRLVEEICMLDNLSHGRLEVGVGRGASQFELAHLGVDVSKQRELFAEALEVVLAGLKTERLTHNGANFSYENAPIEVRPYQQPSPPFWYAASNPESVAWCGRNAINMLHGGTASGARSNFDLYFETWEAHRDDPARINVNVTAPRVGLTRQVFVADTDEEAMTVARVAHAVWSKSFVKLWHEYGDTHLDPRTDFDRACSGGAVIVGSPESVRRTVTQHFEESGGNYLMGSFAWGALTPEQSLHSIDLFAREVMPAFD